MLIWALVLIVLGVLAFLDSLFAFGEIFRRVNAVMFLLVSLGLLFEIRYMKRTVHPANPDSGKTFPSGSKESIQEEQPVGRETASVRSR